MGISRCSFRKTVMIEGPSWYPFQIGSSHGQGWCHQGVCIYAEGVVCRGQVEVGEKQGGF